MTKPKRTYVLRIRADKHDIDSLSYAKSIGENIVKSAGHIHANITFYDGRTPIKTIYYNKYGKRKSWKEY